ncbi:MAG: glycosyl hydrolase family 18 protein [Gemmatimonadales bacterium]
MSSIRDIALRMIGLALIALGPALIHPGPLAAQAGGERLFYYVDRLNSFESLQNHIDQIDVLAPQSYSVDADGVVWGEVDPRVLRLAREHDVPVMPLIVNPGFDADLLHELLSDEAARRRTIETLVEECRRHGFVGIQFDFENLHLRDRDAFTRFYRETAQALHAAGFKLSVAVVHRLDDYPGPTAYHGWLFEQWRAGYDLQALGEIGDFISIMSYSQHTRRTPPGPAAGMPWVRGVIEYFLKHVPAEKLSMGIPLWSMHWYTSWEEDLQPERARSYSRSLSHPEAIGLLERHGARVLWSEDQQVPYAFYSNGGVFEWVFLEDARSFAAKLDLIGEYGLLGFSAWVLGSEDPEIWQVLDPEDR